MAEPHVKIPALTLQEIARFWSKVKLAGPDECWEWTGGRFDDNYGLFRARRISGTSLRANRVAYRIDSGIDPAEFLVCHTCDNPPCCNPAHLFLGTVKANAVDCMIKGRLRPGFYTGWHKLHPEVMQRGDAHWTHRHPDKPSRGEKNGAAKFTESKVREIRNRYKAGGVSQSQIARELHVCSDTIRKIVLRQTWKHVCD